MDDDTERWAPYGDPWIPTVDVPDEPQEIGRLYGPDGSLLLVIVERRTFGFTQ